MSDRDLFGFDITAYVHWYFAARCCKIKHNYVRVFLFLAFFFHRPYIRDTFCNETSALLIQTSNSRVCLWPNDFLAVLLRAGKHVVLLVFPNFKQ